MSARDSAAIVDRMGVFAQSGSATSVTLRPSCRVGRSRDSDVHIDDPTVSGEHAVIRWTEDGWQIRDLGSRNGTWIDGTRLAAGASAALRPGVPVDDDGPPTAVAVSAGQSEAAIGGFLVLPPDADEPAVCIYRDAAGGWVAEEGGSTRAIADRDVVQAGGEAWTLYLPGTVAGTVDATDVRPRLGALKARFSVSPDEEYVELELHGPIGTFALGARAYHYMLLTLARARVRDAAEADLAATSHGWLYQDDLVRMLGVDDAKLNVDIFRARRQVAGGGVDDAASLVERRPSTRQLRFGMSRIETVRL